MTTSTQKFEQFVHQFEALMDSSPSEPVILDRGAALLRELVAKDDWLPEEFAQSGGKTYGQYLLHLDAEKRFSVVSFVWGPGQSSPIHNHTTWGLIGMLRGEEVSRGFRVLPDGTVAPDGAEERLKLGEVERVSPSIGDVHQVSNALPNQSSISIHVYGGDIGHTERTVFAESGERKTFFSGYSNA